MSSNRDVDQTGRGEGGVDLWHDRWWLGAFNTAKSECDDASRQNQRGWHAERHYSPLSFFYLGDRNGTLFLDPPLDAAMLPTMLLFRFLFSQFVTDFSALLSLNFNNSINCQLRRPEQICKVVRQKENHHGSNYACIWPQGIGTTQLFWYFAHKKCASHNREYISLLRLRVAEKLLLIYSEYSPLRRRSCWRP